MQTKLHLLGILLRNKELNFVLYISLLRIVIFSQHYVRFIETFAPWNTPLYHRIPQGLESEHAGHILVALGARSEKSETL